MTYLKQGEIKYKRTKKIDNNVIVLRMSVTVAVLKTVARKSSAQNLQEFLKDLLKDSILLTLKKITETEIVLPLF